MSEGYQLQHEGTPVSTVRPTLLRQARESRGLHVAALAAALKVPVRKLEALEEGAYEELPDLMFARALASSACRHLKVDAGPILAEMPASALPKLGDSPQTINAPFKAPEDAPAFTLGALLTRPMAMAVAAILAVTAALLLTPGLENLNWADWLRAQVSGGSETVAFTPVEDAAPATVSEPVAPSLQVAPQLSVASDAAGPLSGVASEPAAPADVAGSSDAEAGSPVASDSAASASAERAAVDSTTDTATASPSSESPAPGGLMQIRATGETWVEVVNGAGEVVINRVLTSGESLSFSSSPPYSVVIGNSGAAEVTVRGQAYDITPYARNRVARFQVK